MDCSTAHNLAAAGSGLILCIQESASGLKWLAGPAVGVVGLVSAALFAWLSINNARSIARKKATLDLIEKFESTEHYRQLTDAFTRVRDDDSFALFVRPAKGTAEYKTRIQLLDYLNHYELVAIGILSEVLDEKMYRDWMKTAFVRDWKAAQRWVQEVRQRGSAYNAVPYQNYEKIAVGWSGIKFMAYNYPPPLDHIDSPTKSIEPPMDLNK